MLIDGNKINQEIKEELRDKAKGLSLAIIWVGDNPVSAKYIERKKKFGDEIGVQVSVFKYGEGIMTSELAEEIKTISRDYSGIIVQLPLPKNIDVSSVLNNIPINKDVDLLSDKAYQGFIDGKSKILPPVVASIKEILDRNNLGGLEGLNAVVVGAGKLVGRPVAVWLANRGAKVVSITKDSWADLSAVALAKADIIVSGAGVPNLITSNMVRDGVIVIDASTSDVAGSMVGDVELSVADKAKLFSPVPGGVGPITVAMLFKNLMVLSDIR